MINKTAIFLEIILALTVIFLIQKTVLATTLEAADSKDELIYILNEYHYKPASPADNVDAGQALCGTSCSGLSVDYQNFLQPPGWRLIKVLDGKEVTVDMHNPFIGGTCICVVDEYLVKVNELYMSK